MLLGLQDRALGTAFLDLLPDPLLGQRHHLGAAVLLRGQADFAGCLRLLDPQVAQQPVERLLVGVGSFQRVKSPRPLHPRARCRPL
jgi:hypothetical protein